MVAVNTSEARRTRFVYNDPASTITTFSDQVSLNDDAIRGEIVYDGLGRTIESRHYIPTGHIKTKTEFDGMGRVSRIYNAHQAPNEETYGYTDTTYDGLSRVKTITTKDGNNVSTGTVTTDCRSCGRVECPG